MCIGWGKGGVKVIRDSNLPKLENGLVLLY